MYHGHVKMRRKMVKSKVSTEVVESVESELFKNVRAILAKARATVYTAANTAMVEAYWNVGREIVEKQGGASRAKYGDGLVKSLAVRLTAEFGEGFTVPNLRNMRQFYLTFPKRYALRSELNWTHYRILMRVESDDARDYYFNECVEAKWSTRILQRQIDTQFYERLVRNHSPKAARGLVLKVGKVTPQDIGQMQLYKHYYEREMMRPGDNPPVGIVLGSSADSAVVKYTLNEHERNLFAVKYHLSLPTVEELQLELKRERAAIEESLLLQELNEK